MEEQRVPFKIGPICDTYIEKLGQGYEKIDPLIEDLIRLDELYEKEETPNILEYESNTRSFNYEDWIIQPQAACSYNTLVPVLITNARESCAVYLINESHEANKGRRKLSLFSIDQNTLASLSMDWDLDGFPIQQNAPVYQHFWFDSEE